MNEDRMLEHEIRATLGENAPMLPPNHLLQTFEYNASRSRRYPRWLALIKEPSMRSNNSLAVGSPTARVAAILATTLLLAVALVTAGVAGQRLLASDGEIIVAQDGSGTYATITEAVAVADDGDTILVRPGTYTEAVEIEKDVIVRGDGDVAAIILVAPEDGPSATTYDQARGEPYAALLSESSGSLSGLTFRGERSLVVVTGGSPTVEGNVFDDVGWAFGERGLSYGGSSIVANAGSTARLADNTVIDGGPIAVFGMASPVIEGNHLEGGPHIFLSEPGPETVVRGNDISSTINRAIGQSGPGAIVIEDNRITDPGGVGIRIGQNAGAVGFEPWVRNNTIVGAANGIEVTAGGSPQIVGNTLSDNGTGIAWSGASGTIEDNSLIDNGTGMSLRGVAGVVTGNTVDGGRSGIIIAQGSMELDGNEVTGASGRGIAIAGGSSPVLTGNVSCDNGENLWVADDATPIDDGTNEICESVPTE